MFRCGFLFKIQGRKLLLDAESSKRIKTSEIFFSKLSLLFVLFIRSVLNVQYKEGPKKSSTEGINKRKTKELPFPLICYANQGLAEQPPQILSFWDRIGFANLRKEANLRKKVLLNEELLISLFLDMKEKSSRKNFLFNPFFSDFNRKKKG